MSIIRVKKDAGYFVASNKPFNDERLSWEARGVMGYLLSKPDNWECRNQDLINRGPAGGHKISRIMKELKDAGYLCRTRYQNKDGLFLWVTYVYETPITVKAEDLTIPRLSTNGLSTDGKPHHIISTDLINTEEEAPPQNNQKQLQHKELAIKAAQLLGIDHLPITAQVTTLNGLTQWLVSVEATPVDIDTFYTWWWTWAKTPPGVKQVKQRWAEALAQSKPTAKPTKKKLTRQEAQAKYDLEFAL